MPSETKEWTSHPQYITARTRYNRAVEKRERTLAVLSAAQVDDRSAERTLRRCEADLREIIEQVRS